MFKVAVVGAESSGKTTLARDLAQAIACHWLPEYARDYFEARPGLIYGLDDVVAIAEGQRAGESDPARWRGAGAVDGLVCDTNALVCKIWAEVRYGHCPAAISAAWPADDYLLHVLPSPDIAWEPDPLREHPHDRAALFALYEAALQQSGVVYCTVSGTPAQRVEAVIQHLRGLPGFSA
ncbi:AAA family ATPase [Chitinimonas naiadis]